MMRTQQRQSALALGEFRAVERAVEFRRIGAMRHDGDRIKIIHFTKTAEVVYD
jgi:hypothetical protein